MIPLIQRFFHDLLWSPERARLWFRGLLTWGAMSAAQVVTQPPEVIAAWHLKDWAVRLGIAGIAGLAVLVKVGEKNPTEPKS